MEFMTFNGAMVAGFVAFFKKSSTYLDAGDDVTFEKNLHVTFILLRSGLST